MLSSFAIALAATTPCSREQSTGDTLEIATKLGRDEQYHEAVTLYEGLLATDRAPHLLPQDTQTTPR